MCEKLQDASNKLKQRNTSPRMRLSQKLPLLVVDTFLLAYHSMQIADLF